MTSNARCKEILDSISGHSVLVVGDMIMDEYLWGSVKRISPEAPVMVVEAERYTYTPGGAGNVAKNIKALGGESSIIGVVGDDDTGRSLVSGMSDSGIRTEWIVADAERPTTKKTRVIAHSQQVVRVDCESRAKLSDAVTNKIISGLEAMIPAHDIIIFSDYDKGMAGNEVMQALFNKATECKKRVVINAKPKNVSKFKSGYLMTVNQSEAEAATGIPITDENSLHEAANSLLQIAQVEIVLITRGPLGMCVVSANGNIDTIPAHVVEVYDVAGAGDTVISVLTLALTAGASVNEAAVIANCAGGAVVRKVGVATVTREEIADMLNA